MNDMPTIRVEFESMRHSMLAAINQHVEEISQVAESQLKELLSDSHFLTTIRDQMEITVRAAISEAVERSIKREVQTEVDKIVHNKFSEIWQKYWDEATK